MYIQILSNYSFKFYVMFPGNEMKWILQHRLYRSQSDHTRALGVTRWGKLGLYKNSLLSSFVVIMFYIKPEKELEWKFEKKYKYKISGDWKKLWVIHWRFLNSTWRNTRHASVELSFKESFESWFLSMKVGVLLV